MHHAGTTGESRKTDYVEFSSPSMSKPWMVAEFGHDVYQTCPGFEGSNPNSGRPEWLKLESGRK